MPICQVECHEGGGTECVPDRHIVGDLRERDERHEKAEHGKQCRRQTFAPEVKENAAKCREDKHTRCPDEEVIEDQRAIPVLPIRPRIEKRKGQTPEQPRHHRSDHASREEGYARPVLHEHENTENRQECGEKILRPHILSHIDITRDQRQKIRACRDCCANPLIRPLRRKIHRLLHYSIIKISRSCRPNIRASACVSKATSIRCP